MFPLFMIYCDQKLLSMKLKLSPVVIICFCLVSCSDTGPYLKHELEFKKLGDDCSGQSAQMNMNSNTNGERYEFEECLDADFNEGKMQVERKGDTVVVKFSRTNPRQSLYKMVLDINTYPRYNFLKLGDNTLHIIPAN